MRHNRLSHCLSHQFLRFDFTCERTPILLFWACPVIGRKTLGGPGWVRYAVNMFVQSWLCQQIKTYNEFFEQAEKLLAQHAQSHLHAKLRADFQNQNPPLRTSTSSQLQMRDFFGFPQSLSCDHIESKRFAIFTDAVRKHWRFVRDDETKKPKENLRSTGDKQSVAIV